MQLHSLPAVYLLHGECARRLQPVAAAHPRRDDVLGHVEDAGVVAVLEAAAEGDGEGAEGEADLEAHLRRVSGTAGKKRWLGKAVSRTWTSTPDSNFVEENVL